MSSLIWTIGALAQAPRHSTSVSVNRPSAVVAPFTSPWSLHAASTSSRAAQHARRRAADLDVIAADRRHIVHRVEAHDLVDAHVRHADLRARRTRSPGPAASPAFGLRADLALGEIEQRHRRRLLAPLADSGRGSPSPSRRSRRVQAKSPQRARTSASSGMWGASAMRRSVAARSADTRWSPSSDERFAEHEMRRSKSAIHAPHRQLDSARSELLAHQQAPM